MKPTLATLLALCLLVAAALAQGDSPGVREARALLQQKNWSGAAARLEALVDEEPENATVWYLLGYARQAGGDFRAALEAHEVAAGFPAVRAGACYNAACATARLGELDEAFRWLGEARKAGFANLQLLLSDPDLATLRNDPRFQALLPVGAPLTFVEDVPVLTVFDGEAAGDQFGWIGRNAGDTDGDGVNDVLLSAPFKTVGQGRSAGRVYVYSGKTGELRYQQDGGPGYQLGIGIECAGDVDADGVPDQVAGAVGAYGTGAAFVYSGADGHLLLEVRGEAAGDNFGRKVAGAGDQDGDGHEDFIVGAPTHDGVGADSGRAYVVSGATGAFLHVLDGERAGDNFGRAVDACAVGDQRLLVVGAPNAGPGNRGRVSVFRVEADAPRLAFQVESQGDDANLGYMFVSVVGDVNGDGALDVYASDWSSNANGLGGSGRIYVHSGADGARLHTLAGERPGDGFGIGTAEAGDVDGDGCDDLLIGAWQHAAAASSGGKCYLYSGKTGALLRAYTCSTPGETFGFDTTGLGDVNGDGTPDFLITGAYSYVAGQQSGRAYIVAGERPAAADAD